MKRPHVFFSTAHARLCGELFVSCRTLASIIKAHMWISATQLLTSGPNSLFSGADLLFR